MKRAKIVWLLHGSAKKGSVPAQKQLEMMTRPAEADAAAEICKKAKRQMEAEQSAAIGKVAAPSSPKLVVTKRQMTTWTTSAADWSRRIVAGRRLITWQAMVTEQSRGGARCVQGFTSSGRGRAAGL